MLFDQGTEDFDPRYDGHQIDPDRPVPGCVCPHAVGTGAAHAGVVHQNMHLAIASDHGVGRRRKFPLERDVRPEPVNVGVRTLQVLDGLPERGLFDVAEHDLYARLCERGRYSKSDAGGRARHECGLSRQVFHRRLLRANFVDEPSLLTRRYHHRYSDKGTCAEIFEDWRKPRARRLTEVSQASSAEVRPLSIYLFQVASQKSEWLSARQTAVANNVANANTPGYRALDVQPFSAVLDASPIAMAATDPGQLGADALARDAFRQVETDPTEETLSGNTVNLEQEMIKLGDVTRDFTMTANIRRAFHQLMLSALK